MTTAQSVQEQTTNSASYERMLQKGMAVACFLFGLLLLVAAVYRLTGEDTIHETSGFLNSNDIYINNFLWLAWLAGIGAMIGLAQLVKDKKPILAFCSTVCVFIGSVMQVGWIQGLSQNGGLTGTRL